MAVRTFSRRNKLKTKLVIGAITAGFFLYLAVHAVSSNTTANLPWVVAVIVFIVATEIVNCIELSDIVVDDNGIAYALFGKEWRRIPWKSVRFVMIVNWFDVWAYPFTGKVPPFPAYRVHATGAVSRFRRGGPIVFSSRDPHAQELRAAINKYIRLHNIAVRDIREDEKGTTVNSM